MTSRLLFLTWVLWTGQALGFTANRIGATTLQNGMTRLVIEYTVPDLKEKRIAEIDFASRRKATEVYTKIVRGADFYFKDPGMIVFNNPAKEIDPW